MTVITISREYASGAKVFAEKLAEKLEYSVLEKEMVARIAEDLNISKSDASLFEKERQSRILRFLDRYTSHTVKRVVDRSYGRLDDRSYYEAASKLVLGAAEEGKVIILGWGSQCILSDHPHTFHLRIVKSLNDRIPHVRKMHSVDEKTAQALIEREDREKASYIEHYFNCSWDDAHLYHMVLNLSRLSMEHAMDLVLSTVKRGGFARKD